MTESHMLYRGAGRPLQVQKEIVLKALEPSERALSVAADLIVSAMAAPEGQRHGLVLEGLGALYRRAVRDAQAGAGK